MLSFTRHKKQEPQVIIPSLIAQKETDHMSKKRAFFFSSVKLRGSMALEGSMVLPIFLFFIMTVLLALEAVRIQSNMREALYQAGNETAFTENCYKENGGTAESAGNIAAYMAGQQFPYLCVAGGERGIEVQDLSSVETNGLVHLKACYGLKPFIHWIPIGEIMFEDEFYSHAWVGFCGNEQAGQQSPEETCVFVTRTGNKYHRSCECTYLRVPIKMVGIGQAIEARNASGRKYYPCERCHPKESSTVFISEDGSRYHGRSDCSSLKRTVYMIPLSKAQGYTPCSKCGG